MLPNIEVIVGTYEEFLLGYRLESKPKPALAQSFADKSHAGAIKCLAVHGHWVASGSTDDRIFVYDMRTRKQTEIIIAHQGTINALVFAPDGTHLFSGGEDGHMLATQVNNWKTSACWKKAHGGSALTHISCHPSSKLALSLGSDLILRTWNLIKGRVAYKSNLKSRSSLGRVADCLAWSPTGDYFTLTGQRVVEIWSIQKADVVRSQKTNAKPICLCWVSDEVCLVGLEDGKLLWVTLNEDEKEVIVEAHESRVKAMAVLEKTLVTASSAGEIKVWQIDVSKMKLTEISATNIGCRPTCIGILYLSKFNSTYKVAADVEDSSVSVSSVAKKPKPAQGVVTIEYEKEDSDDESGRVIEEDATESSEESDQVDDEDEASEEENESGSDVEEEEEEDSIEEEIQTKSKKRKSKPVLSNVKKPKLIAVNKKNAKPQGKNFKRKNK